jgi:hypothetical protein
MQNDAQIGQTEHFSSLPHQDVPCPFERAIRLLVPSRSHKAMVDLFDGRYGYWSIRNWRRGKRPPPRWALDRLAARLREEEERARRIAGILAEVVPGRGQGSHRNICKWNQQRNRLIRE